MKKMIRLFVFYSVNFLLSLRYKIKVFNVPKFDKNKGVLLISNHTSFIDSFIISASCNKELVFVFPEKFKRKWYVSCFMNIFEVIETENFEYQENELMEIENALKQKKIVCMFPEKAITYSGQMGEFHNEADVILKNMGDSINVYAISLKGLFGSYFSRASNRIKRSKNTIIKRRPVYVAFGNKTLPENTSVVKLKQEIFKLSVKTWDDYLNNFKTIPEEFIKVSKKYKRKTALVDSTGVKVNYNKALISILALRELIIKNKEDNIGVMLPTTAVGAMFNMAVLMAGKRVVNLNYTSPVSSISSSIKRAGIKTLYTSEQFIDKLEKRGVDLSELFTDVNVLFLEKEKNKINFKVKLKSLLSSVFLPTFALQNIYCKEKDINKTATILFSSGSEGEPKGVKLTHKNIMTNIKQVSDAVNIDDDDSVLGSLPLFHAFGLTITTFWPMVEGMTLVCHPDPRDVGELGKLIYNNKVTIMCSTNSFLNLFNESEDANPLMLKSIKMIVAGAEKVKNSTRKNFQLKFNKEIYEGYGATETGPVASSNIPNKLNVNNWMSQLTQKIGTVGMPLPGGAFKIVDPDTKSELSIGDEGMILIAGNQLMKGYLNDTERNKSSLIFDEDDLRWYITGDKGSLDEDGFLTIVDRYSRFAKIKGEMISLTALEQEIVKNINVDDVNVVAVNVDDERSGEKIVLLFKGDVSEDFVIKAISDSNISFISRPKHYFKVDEIPLLGSGKLDFSSSKKLTLEKLK